MHNTGEEEPGPREKLVEHEHQARIREQEDWPKRLEEICREAELRWWATHPWLSSAPEALAPRRWCVRVPVPELTI